MSASVLPFAEVDNSLAGALAERGVAFPMGGFAPGLYVQTCQKCGKRHTAAKRSISCLPCAIANAVDAGLKACASQSRAFHRGRKAGLDDVARFIAAGAQTWRAGLPPAPMTAEQREDVKRQGDDRRGVDPEGAAVVDDLVARTRAARARIEAERRAAESADTDPDGGDAA